MEHSDLLKIKDGDECAFQMLFIEYYSPLVSFANKFITDQSRAEDIVQDIFIKIWEGREKISNIKNISAYLYQTVRFSCYNFIRDKKIFPDDNMAFVQQVKISSSIEEMIIEEESFRLYLKEMESLPPKCRKVFSLSLEGLMAKEIAEELNIAIETVKKQKKIAKRILREKCNRLIVLFYPFCG